MTPYIFQNLEFFLLLGPALVLVALAKRLGAVPFKIAIVALSAFFIAVLPGLKMAYVGLLSAILLMVYLLGLALLRVPASRRKLIAFIALGGVVLFALVKFGSVTSLVSQALGLSSDYRTSLLPIFGFAFLVVKSYSLLADICAGTVKQLRPLDFLTYFLFFPTFLAGPIDRFSAFLKSLQDAALERGELKLLQTELARFLIGAFKVFVIAGLLQRYALPFMKEADFDRGGMLYLGAAGYYAYEYMNFSGYSDMAISTARVMGIRLPENFNLPFMARSLTELWRRWHMTFAAWLRDYIYYPVLFVLMKRVRPEHAGGQVALSAVSVFLTFVICGLWHGDHFGMILFGTLSGAILALETIITARYGARVGRLLKERPHLGPVYDWGARIVTFHLAILTFAPVLLSAQQLGYLARYFSTLTRLW